MSGSISIMITILAGLLDPKTTRTVTFEKENSKKLQI